MKNDQTDHDPEEVTNALVKNLDDSALADTVEGRGTPSDPTANTMTFLDSADQTQAYDPEQTRASEIGSSKSSLTSLSSHSIPGYQILGELGRGGMGVVFKAKQIQADRVVALKLMVNADSARAEEVARFDVEVKAAASLKHPNIVQVYDVGLVGAAPYFTQEYLSGGSLGEKIREKLPSHRETAEAMLQLARAMAYAHRAGIVHRDLKPANILVADDGMLKIADFGLARRLKEQSNLTQDGTIIGTPSYMAPEQASGSIYKIGPVSDVYALGAILYELLTGRPPFKGATVWEVINQVRSTEPASPVVLRPDTPKDLETICLKCLQKDPAKRYPSAEDLAEDLRRHLENEPILARPISRWERLVRFCRKHPRETSLVGTLAAVLLLVAVGASWAAVHMARQRNQIAAEKQVSDQRLDLYRGTVSTFVNRVPQVLENAPFASGLRKELNQLVDDLLQSTDTSAAKIGPSQQWGLAGILIRRGEAKMTEAQALPGDERDNLLRAAGEDLNQAYQVLQEVLNSGQGDKAKALGNMALVQSVRAASKRIESDVATATDLYNNAIELRREALNIEISEKSISQRQAELGRELANLAECQLSALDSNSTSPERQRALQAILSKCNEAVQLLDEAVNAAAQESSHLPNMLRDLTIACELAGMVGTKLNSPEVEGYFEKGISAAGKLVEVQPDRVANTLNQVRISSMYGDYHLVQKKDPIAARKYYVASYLSLRPLALSREISNIQELGLAMTYYRLGLSTLHSDVAKAQNYFERCTMIRELELRQLQDDRSMRDNPDRLLHQRIGLMLSRARCGQLTLAIAEARNLVHRASDGVPLDHLSRKDLLTMAAAGLSIAAEQSPDEVKAELLNEAVDALKLAVEAGFNDRDYLHNDPDLGFLQTSSRFSEIIALLEHQT